MMPTTWIHRHHFDGKIGVDVYTPPEDAAVVVLFVWSARDRQKHVDPFAMSARSYIVYRGTTELEIDGTRVLPLGTFLRRLHAGEIIG
jgi:hypothetical protein